MHLHYDVECLFFSIIIMTNQQIIIEDEQQ